MAYARSCACVLVVFASSAFSSQQSTAEPPDKIRLNSEPVISKLKSERAHGRGFKLEYLVSAPLDVFWDYRTNFDNELLHQNKYIVSHRLVSHEDNLVITETEYTYKPKAVFKWQTTVHSDRYLLEYTLLNPKECSQKYHYGYIQLQEEGDGTRVTHVAYFDFFGASFWVNYPFKGGMTRFLEYTAQWEQQLASELEYPGPQ